jgi:hypothetical protein
MMKKKSEGCDEKKGEEGRGMYVMKKKKGEGCDEE